MMTKLFSKLLRRFKHALKRRSNDKLWGHWNETFVLKTKGPSPLTNNELWTKWNDNFTSPAKKPLPLTDDELWSKWNDNVTPPVKKLLPLNDNQLWTKWTKEKPKRSKPKLINPNETNKNLN